MATWREEALRLRAQGQTVRQIAAAVGKAPSTVGYLVTPLRCACGGVRGHQANQCGDCERRERAGARAAQLEDIALMWDEGMSIREIAAELGWGPNSAPPQLQELRAAGRIGLRHASKDRALVDVRTSVVDGCWRDGWPVPEIAATVGLTDSGVDWIIGRLRRYGSASRAAA